MGKPGWQHYGLQRITLSSMDNHHLLHSSSGAFLFYLVGKMHNFMKRYCFFFFFFPRGRGATLVHAREYGGLYTLGGILG